MINELYHLSEAMKRANISADKWHRKYIPIPNINKKAPCIRIILAKGKIVQIESVDTAMGKLLRKFGTNQGTFPAMNLQPLYRMTNKENETDLDIETIRSWCQENNWDNKFNNKYLKCMQNTPDELRELMSGEHYWNDLDILFRETDIFIDQELLYNALEKEAFRLIEQKTDMELAMRILFHSGNSKKNQEDDSGSLSVIFDSQELIDSGNPVVSEKFTLEFNRRLLEADNGNGTQSETMIDAFGDKFIPIEDPMPKVKLAGGFDVSLRTMFKGQPCQNRYGKIEDGSYPISKNRRIELAGALSWVSSENHKNITWINIDKDEIFFAYPFTMPQIAPDCVRMFKRIKNDSGKKIFEEEAKAFIKSFYGLRETGLDSNADRIQIFIIRKIDKARTKIIYTRTTNSHEIEHRSEAWCAGTKNLPKLSIGQPETLFPLDTADILNRIWKQNGDPLTEKFQPVPRYHCMELFFGAIEQSENDLSVLIRNTEPLAPFIGKNIATHNFEKPLIIEKIQQAAALIGFLLSERNIRKENYMQNFAYLYGQLLKISDELHLMYCRAVRGGDIPAQLAGGSMYMSAADAPLRTMGVLGDRMNPYINWANTYQHKNSLIENSESWRAGWLLKLYRENAEQVKQTLERNDSSRFTDEEKAQFFLGFIAAFPKKAENNTDSNNGGNENE